MKKLSLNEKVDLIKNSKGKSQRALATQYGIGKTQVQRILKRKADLFRAFEENIDGDRKRTKLGTAQYQQDVDSLTLSWFQKARSHNLLVSGPLIKQKALEFSKAQISKHQTVSWTDLKSVTTSILP